MVTDTVTCSDRCRAILNLDGEPPLRAIFERIHPDDREHFETTMKAVAIAGAFQTEIRIVDQAGEIRWLDIRGKVAGEKAVTAPAANGARSPSRFLGTLIDI